MRVRKSMGRAPCCEKETVKRGSWTPDEDAKLLACIAHHGTGSWRTVPKKAGLQRCGKSCRLRWTNYLRPDLKHGRFSDHEEQTIVRLHAALGSRWSLIAAQLPGRTDNDVKNYWNTRLKKKLCEMGIDPITHKPISQLLADLAGSMTNGTAGDHNNNQSPTRNPPCNVNANPAISSSCSAIADAALGCFKDDMLHHLLMRRQPAVNVNPPPLLLGCNYPFAINFNTSTSPSFCSARAPPPFQPAPLHPSPFSTFSSIANWPHFEAAGPSPPQAFPDDASGLHEDEGDSHVHLHPHHNMLPQTQQQHQQQQSTLCRDHRFFRHGATDRPAYIVRDLIDGGHPSLDPQQQQQPLVMMPSVGSFSPNNCNVSSASNNMNCSSRSSSTCSSTIMNLASPSDTVGLSYDTVRQAGTAGNTVILSNSNNNNNPLMNVNAAANYMSPALIPSVSNIEDDRIDPADDDEDDDDHDRDSANEGMWDLSDLL